MPLIGARAGRRAPRERTLKGESFSSSESAHGTSTQSEKPKFIPMGVRVGVEYGVEKDESEDVSENAELMLSVRSNEARPTGFRDKAANC